MQEELKEVALVLMGRAQLGDHVDEGYVNEHASSHREHPGACILSVAQNYTNYVADYAQDAREEVIEEGLEQEKGLDPILLVSQYDHV